MSDTEEISFSDDSDVTYVSNFEDVPNDIESDNNDQATEEDMQNTPASPVIGRGSSSQISIGLQPIFMISDSTDSEENIIEEESSNSPVLEPDTFGSENSNSSIDSEPEQSTSRISNPPALEQPRADIGHSPHLDVLLIPPQNLAVPGHSENVTQAALSVVCGVQEREQTPSCEITPKKKIDKTKVPKSSESDDEGQVCTICFETWSNSGTHRLVSLKCGHLFGHSCIERWLKGQGGKCPQCNAKATKRDIRVIYAKALKVIDTTEKDRAIQELEKEKEVRRTIELEHAQTKMKYEMKCQVVRKLQEELNRLKNAAAGSSSNTLLIGVTQGSSGVMKNRLVLHSCLEITKDGGCRVMAYNEWLNMMVVSMPSQVTMFPGSGVKKLNIIDVKAERYVPIHSKQLRDLAFNPAKNDLLLSVGMDKLVKLTNICSNTPVGSFNADIPVWSCCWNNDQANEFFVGTATGVVILYDTRNTSGPVKTIQISGSGPIVSMCYIPCCASATFCSGGVLVARLQSCSFLTVKDSNDIRDNGLPLEGPFTSVSFERATRHILVSCRPSQKYPHARHLVCELQNVNISADAGTQTNVVTTNIIQTFKGGTTQKVLSRSCLIAHPFKTGTILACASDESTQSTFIWDVSTGTCLQQLKCYETVIDILPVKQGQNSYLTVLTEKAVRFYKWVDVL